MSDTNDKKEIISQEVRAFFKNISWKKILTFLFFLLLSCIFWMMQIYRQKYEATLTIPVKYINIPDSIVFEDKLPSVISARIRDDGGTLFKYLLTRWNDSMVVDVRDVVKSTPDKIIQGRNFEQLIRNKLFATSELISYTPTRMSYIYALLHDKKLPVIYNGNVNLAGGHMLIGDLSISPDSVIVYGSQTALDTLFYAYTVSDTMYNVSSEQKVKVAMKPMQGIKYIPDEVSLTIPADKFIEKEVEVSVTCINLPNSLSIKFFPSSVKIPYLVGSKKEDDITKEKFSITIDYNDIKDLSRSSVPVRITDSPDYIRTKIPIPSEVEFVLEKQ
jgi:hypothetical protein